MQGEIEEDLDLSGLPRLARQVALKQAKQRVIMRRKQALWAARGAAALAAASDMPGSPRQERPTTPDRGAVASDTPREHPGTTLNHLGSPPETRPDGAAAFDGPSATAAEEGVGVDQGGEEPQRVSAQLAELGEAAAEQPARAGIERRGGGAVEGPESTANGSHGQRDPGRGPQAKRRQPAKSAGKMRGVTVQGGPSRAKNRVPSKASTAAADDRASEHVRKGKASQRQALKTAAALESCQVPNHAPEEPASVEHPSAHEQDGMDGLEYDILGLPVIPKLGNGHGTTASALPDDLLHLSNADQSGFESDVSDDEENREVPATAAHEPPLNRVSIRSAQSIPDEHAVARSRGAENLGTSKANGSGPAAEEAWSGGLADDVGTERGPWKIGSKPGTDKAQGTACQVWYLGSNNVRVTWVWQ